MKLTERPLIWFFALVFLLSSAAPIRSATITWNNTSGGNWNDAGNWTPSQVPGAADTATITLAGTYVVIINDSEGAGTFTIGAPTGSQTLRVSSGGVFNNVSSGTVAANASLTVEASGTLNMSSTFNLYGPLTNKGTINMTNAGFSLFNNNTASLTGGIENDGAINFYGISGDRINSEGYGYEYLINQGTISEETGAGITSINGLTDSLEGNYNAASGTVIQFAGGGIAGDPLTVGALPTLTGPGQYEFTGGYLLLTVDVVPNLALIGGTLELGPAFQQGGAITNLTLAGITLGLATNRVVGTLIVSNSTINGVVKVNGGVLNGFGVTLAANGSLTIGGTGTLNVSSTFNLYGPLTNNGTVNLTNAGFSIYNNNTATLLGGIDNNGAINFYGASGDHLNSEGYGNEYLINQGTINEETGAGESSIYGLLDALTGTYNAALGTMIQFTGGGTAGDPLTVGAPPVLNGPGQYEFVGSYLLLTADVVPNLALIGGTLELGPAFQQGGAITNLTLEGISLAPGANQVNGTLTMTNSTISGAIVVNSGGVLDGSGLTVTATGSLTIGGGGTLNVSSTFNLYGPLTNNGTVNLTNAGFSIYNNNTSALQGGIDNNGAINFYGISGGHINSEGYGYEYLINQGTINEETGAGNSAIYGLLDALTGTYNAALGTVIQFTGGSTAGDPLTVGAPPVLNGPGQYEFVGSYLLLTENVIPNLALIGGTLELGPVFQQGGAITNLTLDGMSLAPATTQVNGTLTMTNSIINGAITVNDGGVLDGTSVTLAATGSLTIGSGGTLGVFSSWSLYGPLTNNGTINMTNAIFSIFNNNTASLDGGIDNNGEINFYGISGDHITSEGYGYEYLTNQGTISQRPGTGSSSIYVGLFTDPGTLDTQEGTLSVNTVALQSSSVLNFGLNSLTDFGNITFGTSVTLNGTVSANLNNGLSLTTGDTFKVLSYPSFTGIFTQTNLPAGYLGEGVYSATAFNLLITGIGTPPSRPILTIERIGASTMTVSWPAAAGNFNLQTSPTLHSGSWTDVTSGITTIGANFVLTTTVGNEAAFFRLQGL